MNTLFSRFPILAAIAAATLSLAEDPAPTTPDALVAEALSRNAELGFYTAQLDAARAETKTAGRLAQPSVDVQGGQIRSRNPDHSLAGEGAAWSASIRQTFEWPGRLSLRKAIANQDVALATLGLDAFRRELAGKVRETALGLAGSEEKSRIARGVARRFRDLREVLVQRDPAGIAPQLEVRILEATELTLRRRAADSELAANRERIDLNLLRGAALDTPLVVASTGPQLPARPALADLMAAANTNNFELRTRAAELVQQGFRVDLARNERWPSFQVGPSFSRQEGSSLDQTLGVGISFPLPLWRNRDSNVAAAEARRQQAAALLETSRRDVERRVLTAATGYDSHLAELADWTPDAVGHFAEAAELADRHYRLGAVPAATYVELQKQYLEAVESLLDTRRAALAAAVELERATGLGLVGAQPARP